jgi:hypothetical protein
LAVGREDTPRELSGYGHQVLSENRRLRLLLRVAALLWCIAVLVVVAALKPQLSSVAAAVGGVVTLLAGTVVVAGFNDFRKWIREGNLRGLRSPVARLMPCGEVRAGSAPAAPVGEAEAAASGTLAAYLSMRLVDGRPGPMTVTVMGADESGLDRVVAAACRSLGGRIQCVGPPSAPPEGAKALAEWVVNGADAQALPRKHARDSATVFLLGKLDDYRPLGLHVDRFDRWGRERTPWVVLVTAIRTNSPPGSDSEWATNWFRKSHVVPIR